LPNFDTIIRGYKGNIFDFVIYFFKGGFMKNVPFMMALPVTGEGNFYDTTT